MFTDVIFVPEMAEKNYRAAEGLSYSQLKHAKSPAHFKAALDEKREASDDMLFGTLVHALAFQTDHNIVQRPEGLDLRTKDGKYWKASLPDDSEDLPFDRYEGAIQAVKNLNLFAETRSILTLAKFEVSAFGLHQATGTRVKGRTDILWTTPDNMTVLADLKTMQSIEARDVQQTILKLKYHYQAAMYMDLWGASEFWLICVESVAPYANRVFKLGGESIQKGREGIDAALKILREDCGKFALPTYQRENIEIPFWAL